VDEKSSWQSGDVIYISVEGGTYVELKYDGSTWDTSSLTLKKGQSYKAVYAPNYELNNERTGLVLKYGQIAATGEYLVYEGSAYPFIISFTRNYSRMRIDMQYFTSNSVVISLSDGFTPNDYSGNKAFTFSNVEYNSNLYLYGSWTDNTKIEFLKKTISLDTSGSTDSMDSMDSNGVFGAWSYSKHINGDSKENKSYAFSYFYDISINPTSYGYWLVDNLDEASSSFYNWSSFSTRQEVQDSYIFQGIKVIGTWDEDKAPSFKSVFVSVSDDMKDIYGNVDENEVDNGEGNNSTGIILPNFRTST
jgi:hypothetical protein